MDVSSHAKKASAAWGHGAEAVQHRTRLGGIGGDGEAGFAG
jgi:hypothetical protein